MGAKRAGIDHLGNDLADRPRTNQPHVHLKLIAQDLKSTLDALLPIARKRVQEPATDADRRRAEGDGFEHVARTPDTPVDEDGEVGVRPWSFGLERGDDVDEVLDAGAARVKLAATVVAQDDTLAPGFVGQDGVFGSGDTLEDDVHCGVMYQDLQVIESG